jgi:protein tyrosine phosphatase (PTP) superfamily phosphohydrolase (DUF442 family)
MMCDYSLHNIKSRPAAVGDKLVTHAFSTGTTGFVSVDDTERNKTAVCVLPGTEIAFDEPVESTMTTILRRASEAMGVYVPWMKVAIFRQTNMAQRHMHHDMLEFPDGRSLMLTHCRSGQRATVLQLPAAPKTEKEVEEQKRAEYV